MEEKNDEICDVYMIFLIENVLVILKVDIDLMKFVLEKELDIFKGGFVYFVYIELFKNDLNVNVLVEKFFLLLFCFNGYMVSVEFYFILEYWGSVLFCVEGRFEFLDVGFVVGFFW